VLDSGSGRGTSFITDAWGTSDLTTRMDRARLGVRSMYPLRSSLDTRGVTLERLLASNASAISPKEGA
jgi:hypothetical protein